MSFGNRRFAGFLGAATVVLVAEYLLVLSDGVIAGRCLGVTALGAMNLLTPVISLFSFFAWYLAVGTAIVYSDARTKADGGQLAAKLAGQGLLSALALGLIMVVSSVLLERPYLAFLSSGEATTAFSGQYWDWYPLAVVLNALMLMLLYLVYADGGELCCIFAYAGMVIVNIVVSYALCLGLWGVPDMGMEGVSLGTVVAQTAGSLFLLPRFLRLAGGNGIRLAWRPRELVRMLRAPFAEASVGFFQVLVFFVITKILLDRWGEEVLPVAAVVFCVIRLMVFFNGAGLVLHPLVSVYRGTEGGVPVARFLRITELALFASGLIVTVLMFVAPELLVGLFGIGDPEIGDPELVPAAKQAVRTTVIAGPVCALLLFLPLARRHARSQSAAAPASAPGKPVPPAKRYEVLRGQQVTLDDLEAVIELDRMSFESCYQVTAGDDYVLFKNNPENGLIIRDAETGQIVGYSMLLPIREDMYRRIKTGTFVDTDFKPEMTFKLDRPGVYHLYFASVVVHPEHRSAALILTMMDAMVEDFTRLTERGIWFSDMIADVVSLDGAKFCRLFGLKKGVATNHGSNIYEVTVLPPEMRVTTPATRRLYEVYLEKWNSMKGREPVV